MQSQNLSEYILVRKELQEVKNCITQYMGFVLGGSSLSFIGVWFSRRNGEDFLAPAYISLSLSIIVVLVLVILFYKFNSHNRFAGYRKLLIQEVWDEVVPENRTGS